MSSFGARITSLLLSTELEDNFSGERLFDEATTLSVLADVDEPVWVRAKLKSVGQGFRPICSFGPLRKAQQTICGNALRAAHGVEPIDYLSKSKGADRASDRVVELVDAGFRYFVRADVADCFGSVQQERIGDAIEGTLPEAAIMTSIVLPHETMLLLDVKDTSIISYAALDGAARRGLPQGSRTSNLIASVLLGPGLRMISSGDRCVLYGDDVVIACSNEAEALALSKALPGMLASHLAGPFRLKWCEVVDIRKGFDFLKYRHVLRTRDVDVHRRPAFRSYQRYSDKVAQIARYAPAHEVPERIARYRRNWIRAFPRWLYNSYSLGFLDVQTDMAFDDGWKTRTAGRRRWS